MGFVDDSIQSTVPWANVDILGTYSDKEVCVSEQKRATAIGTPAKSSFGCVKIEGVK